MKPLPWTTRYLSWSESYATSGRITGLVEPPILNVGPVRAACAAAGTGVVARATRAANAVHERSSFIVGPLRRFAGSPLVLRVFERSSETISAERGAVNRVNEGRKICKEKAAPPDQFIALAGRRRPEESPRPLQSALREANPATGDEARECPALGQFPAGDRAVRRRRVAWPDWCHRAPEQRLRAPILD